MRRTVRTHLPRPLRVSSGVLVRQKTVAAWPWRRRRPVSRCAQPRRDKHGSPSGAERGEPRRPHRAIRRSTAHGWRASASDAPDRGRQEPSISAHESTRPSTPRRLSRVRHAAAAQLRTPPCAGIAPVAFGGRARGRTRSGVFATRRIVASTSWRRRRRPRPLGRSSRTKSRSAAEVMWDRRPDRDGATVAVSMRGHDPTPRCAAAPASLGPTKGKRAPLPPPSLAPVGWDKRARAAPGGSGPRCDLPEIHAVAWASDGEPSKRVRIHLE
jgi:hypothetical protein